ncbi:hypothetical protein ACIBQX_18390 [Nonomuraea sp. NPDC049714]|uniref:hypothetical protein n=1 Tax=Nonomuraea sp. NPDC049714 TaxID=3364357 RepID=UPI00378878CF
MGSGDGRRLSELRAAHDRVWEISTALVWGAAAWRRQGLDAGGVARGLVNVVVASDLETLAVRLAGQAAVENDGAVPSDGLGVSYSV